MTDATRATLDRLIATSPIAGLGYRTVDELRELLDTLDAHPHVSAETREWCAGTRAELDAAIARLDAEEHER